MLSPRPKSVAGLGLGLAALGFWIALAGLVPPVEAASLGARPGAEAVMAAPRVRSPRGHQDSDDLVVEGSLASISNNEDSDDGDDGWQSTPTASARPGSCWSRLSEGSGAAACLTVWGHHAAPLEALCRLRC